MNNKQLGDKWQDWDGNLEESIRDSAASEWLFLLLSFGWIILIEAGLIFIWFMIAPKLLQIHEWFERGFLWLIIGIGALMLLFFIQLFLTVKFKRNFLIFLPFVSLRNFLWEGCVRIAKLLNISYDRLGNSFVKINNVLLETKASSFFFKEDEILVLFPRCLKKEVSRLANSLVKSVSFGCFTVGGGTQALKLVKEKKPKAIIAVACERDLVRGILDLPFSIPVYAIPNKRIEGPCNNTTINIKELQKAINLFSHTK